MQAQESGRYHGQSMRGLPPWVYYERKFGKAKNKNKLIIPRPLVDGHLIGEIQPRAYALAMWMLGRMWRKGAGLFVRLGNGETCNAFRLDDVGEMLLKELGPWATGRGLRRAVEALNKAAGGLEIKYYLTEKWRQHVTERTLPDDQYIAIKKMIESGALGSKDRRKTLFDAIADADWKRIGRGYAYCEYAQGETQMQGDRAYVQHWEERQHLYKARPGHSYYDRQNTRKKWYQTHLIERVWIDNGLLCFVVPNAIGHLYRESTKEGTEIGFVRVKPEVLGEQRSVAAQRLYGLYKYRRNLKWRTWHMTIDEILGLLGRQGIRKGEVEPLLIRARRDCFDYTLRLNFSPLREGRVIVKYEFAIEPMDIYFADTQISPEDKRHYFREGRRGYVRAALRDLRNAKRSKTVSAAEVASLQSRVDKLKAQGRSHGPTTRIWRSTSEETGQPKYIVERIEEIAANLRAKKRQKPVLYNSQGKAYTPRKRVLRPRI